ncbi:hypothetical protein SAMN05192574_104280 [Mucilaginibacter gossypiicola]|uniref:Uncharacterized protein n=1 Tax=Mucilaginibacter gossypiicola TaxID=551995 RepID=A0A1H8JPX5_9SPHI|nr:hypothetical protein SAMN05192574_104280 [Mucilaginibacter gossypiicola]
MDSRGKRQVLEASKIKILNLLLPESHLGVLTGSLYLRQHIYQVGKSELIKGKYNNYVPYPKNMRDAKAFVEQYKEYAKFSERSC